MSHRRFIMKRSLFALIAVGLLAVAARAPASCGWFGSQLECEVGGRRVLIGTRAEARPRCDRPLALQALDGCDLRADATLERPFRLEFQNVGTDPSLCRKLGDETYCY
jgi:hypothetical protein